jgi:hypothetical protein
MININTPRDVINALQSAKTIGDKSNIVKTVSNNFISYKTKTGEEKLGFNSSGQDIQVIQSILAGLGYLSNDQLSGELDQNMIKALEKIAKKYNIRFDRNNPLSKDLLDLFLGFEFGEDFLPADPSLIPPKDLANQTNWPPKPTDLKPLGVLQAERLYGKIEWKRGSGDGIIVTNGFNQNMITINLPQLAKIKNPTSTKIRCHKLAAQPIMRLWQEWENMGFLNKIENWGGCLNSRTVRPKKKGSGPTNTLSNHAFGVAFDINTISNARGKIPPRIGEKGCIRELVPIANKLGFYWGGHFSHPDGMHFELTRVDTQIMIA